MRKLGLACAVVLAAAAGAACWFVARVRGSLPPLDGTVRVAGLGAPVRLERDHLGVPTIRAQSLADAVRALGFAHGQDRFFQMDLSRRSSAGELAAMFGEAAVPLDRAARRHDFRGLARQAWQRSSAEQKALLSAYSEGVNAGLASLRVKPFEYVVLRQEPDPWRPEDTFLVGYTMLRTLQDDAAVYQRSLYDVRVIFGPQAADFFSPLMGPEDSALDGSTASLPEVPSADVIDLRESGGGVPPPSEAAGRRFHDSEPNDIGSNAFAVAGRRGQPGLLANDMHLMLMLPNTWYRASLVWPGHRMTGVTLPGAPVIVAGSNGHIAWGMTDSYVATADLVAVNTDLPDYYLGPNDLEYPLLNRATKIHVRGHEDVTVTTRWTKWGPIVGHDPLKPNKLLALHWTEDDPAAMSLDMLDLKDALTVDQAIALAHRFGIPAVNFVVADAAGHVGWTIAGRLPQRIGYNGTARWPVSWQYGDRGWKGFLPADEVPQVTGTEMVWSSNQRMVGGTELEKLGDSGYFNGTRGGQVRDDLATLVKRRDSLPAEARRRRAASTMLRPAEMLSVELDDRTVLLGWWHDLILRLRDDDPHAKEHAAFYTAVEHWGGAATVDSVGYRLVREFRSRVVGRVLDPIFQRCLDRDASFEWARFNYEPAVRALIEQQPSHLLGPSWLSWKQLLLSAVDDGARQVEGHTWGRRNTLRDVHPFSHALPAILTGWLNLPAVELPGDRDMPRVQAPDFGASERLVVAPGRENEGIFEMPGGQSGNPLSPYYRAGTQAWERGEPSPFLPGPAEHALLLHP